MMQVISFVNECTREAYRSNAVVEAGQTLYAIQHEDRYFSWCYINAETAKEVAVKLTGTFDGNPSNWKASTNQLVLSGL